MSFIRTVVLTLIVAASLVKCERPQEPSNNYIEIRPVKVDAKLWSNVPPILRFRLAIGGAGARAKIESHDLALSTGNKAAAPTNHPWWVDYNSLESLALKSGDTTGKSLKVSVLSKNMSGAQYLLFAGEIASHGIDMDFIPFSKSVLYVIQDNPSQTRSFKDATGAKLVFSVQRRVRQLPSRDVPSPGTYRDLAETWWVKPHTTYHNYKEHLLLFRSLLQEVYGEEIKENPNFLNSYNLEARVDKSDLKHVKNKIEKYVAQKLRQQLKSLLAAAMARDPQALDTTKVDSSRLGLYWDFYSSENKTRFFTSLLAKSLAGKVQGMGLRLTNGRLGQAFGALLNREINQDDAELAKMRGEALSAVLQARPID